MPIYSYHCLICEKAYEILHGMNDDVPRICRICRQPMEKQQVPFMGIRIKHESYNSATKQKLDTKFDTATYSQRKSNQ